MADSNVASNITGGATGASVGGPIGAVVGAAGSLAGTLLGNAAVDEANRRASNALYQGIGSLNQGIDAATAAYAPYSTQAGSTLSNYINSVNNRQMANQPGLSTYNIADYMNPSAAYSVGQANNAIQSSSLAHGGLGGGLGRALSNNANQMGMTNYNNAYQQMLDTNAQRFGQGQQQFANTNEYQQQQIGNKQNAASLALQGLSAGQQLNANYRNGINSMYNSLADIINGNGGSQAALYQGAGRQIGNQVGSGLGAYIGSLRGSAGGSTGGSTNTMAGDITNNGGLA